jgi:RNA polymerase sigma-70 factor (ECF subfamily)
MIELLEIAERDPNPILIEQEYRTFVAQAALRLMRDSFSETTWRACWEHVVEGRTASQVAVELDISENAVYLARGRVLKRLRDELVGLWE